MYYYINRILTMPLTALSIQIIRPESVTLGFIS